MVVSWCRVAAVAVLLVMSGAGGVTTSRAAGPAAGNQTLLTLACPSVTVCYAGGNNGAILATRDGGATWQAQSSGGTGAIVRLACPSTDTCFAQVQSDCESLGTKVPLLRTTNGGSTWTTGFIPGCGVPLSCPNTTTCYSTISPAGPGLTAVVRTTNGGASWEVQTRVDASRLQEQLACPTATTCYDAFQNATGRSTDAGKHWSITRLASSRPCTQMQNGCPLWRTLTCPSPSTCYTAGSVGQNGKWVAAAMTSRDGFRTHTFHTIPGLLGLDALSCPTPVVCFALAGVSDLYFGGTATLGDSGKLAITVDGGAHWRVTTISAPYLFTTLSCPSTRVCTSAGFLGRVMGSRDAGATWHDQIPAVYVSGTFGATQPVHTYSSWFTASVPWDLSGGLLPGPMGPTGRPPLATGCRATRTVTVSVRNAQNQQVGGPVRLTIRYLVGEGVPMVPMSATGKLRLEVTAQCSAFSVRVDGVQPANG